MKLPSLLVTLCKFGKNTLCCCNTISSFFFFLPSDFCDAEINWFHCAYLGAGTESVWLGRNMPHMRQKHLSGRAESQDPLCSNLPPEPDFCGQTNRAKYSTRISSLAFLFLLSELSRGCKHKATRCMFSLTGAAFVCSICDCTWTDFVAFGLVKAGNSLYCGFGELHCFAVLEQTA